MAYTATVVLDQKSAAPQRVAGSPFAVLGGTIHVTSYNTVYAPITQITNQFRGTPRVIVDGVSISGAVNYLTRWDPVSGCIKAYSALGTEVVSNTDIGTVNFIAIGQMG